MKTISTERARQIASAWHGGQWSALYQFASSGVLLRESAAIYVKEVQDCLNYPESAPHPFTMPQRDARELNSLLRYFMREASRMGVNVTIKPHSFYGYPAVSTETEGVQKPVYPI